MATIFGFLLLKWLTAAGSSAGLITLLKPAMLPGNSVQN